MSRGAKHRRKAMARARAAIPSPAHPEFTAVDPAAVDAETWRPIPTTSTANPQGDAA